MSPELTEITCIAILGVVLLLALSARKTQNLPGLLAGLAAVALFALFLNCLFGFPKASPAVSKGPSDELIMSTALFLCMLLGMFSQHLYNRFLRSKRHRPAWDWGLFCAPVFVSPVVFIPLLAAFESSGINLSNFTSARLMIFFVAFQNGFFWKEFFDRKQEQSKNS